ncbi:MAG: aminoglycoside phosphotransferase family protein [Polyangiales bacterium]
MSTPPLDDALTELYGSPLPAFELLKLRGDASTRSYFRVRVSDPPAETPSSLIVMLLPEDAFGSDEGGKAAATQRLPFLEVAELLESKGLPVPSVYVENLDNRVVLLEDLGDLTFEQNLRHTPRADWAKPYGTAVELLAELHERCDALPEASIVSRRSFDRELLDWELDHFREWGLEALSGPLGSADSLVVRDAFSRIATEVESMPYGFVHRDYQSKNLMVSPSGALTLIDFQDALRGPRVYDLVALLCDSYVSLDLEMQESMIDRYAALRRISARELRREFWLVALHRKLKDAGRFIYIDRVRKNPDFLQWYPQSLVYVGRALGQNGEFESFSATLGRAIPGFPDSARKPASSLE